MDAAGSPVLWLRRPFAFINSRMYVQRLKNFSEYTADGRPVLDTFAEDPRRILTLADEPQPEPEPDENTFTQLAHIDGGFWAWDFGLQDATGIPFARVDRKFRGFGRELFTDTGHFSGTRYLQDGGIDETEPYSLRNLNMEERALVLATAVNIDFDYFSRHSSEGGGFAPFLLLAALFE
ncbi:Scramblase [Epithele typhae]|uniref:Scramblase n=1 Tax=Epithele typhae TaxID=378194 RepID=UPI0020084F28|nr:Scramblase [Epithele typhae]KAH9945984.1 Scramblase [Epithele typhae]